MSATILAKAEQAVVNACIHSSIKVEGGGIGQFIVHGQIRFQVLTEKTR